MTLLELLVQELPERGGWPEGAEQASQDNSGLINFYTRGVIRMGNFGLSWVIPLGSNVKELLEFAFDAELSTDWNKEVVSLDRYESALAASKHPEWDGVGVPPVGAECQFSIRGQLSLAWYSCKILYAGKYHTVFVTDDGEELVHENQELLFRIKQDFKDGGESPDSSDFDLLCKPIIKWINGNANPHAIIVIDGASAVLYSGEKSVLTEEYIKD